ncbi:MAG: hypothetical protein ACOC92_00040 [bacterium]
MRRILWQLGNLTDGEYRRWRKYIRRFCRLSPEQAQTEIARRLHRYLHYCREYSSYWRERWPAGAAEFGVCEAEDVLKELPVLSKVDLHEHLDEIRIRPEQRRSNDGYPPIGKQSTITSGGSTGIPTTVWTDSLAASRNRASYDYLYELSGMAPGEKAFFIWGSSNELRDMRKSFRKRAATWLRGLYTIPAFGLTPGKIEHLVAAMRTHPRIRSAKCYTTAAETLCGYAEAHGGFDCPKLDRILTGGGLLHDQLRQLLLKHLANEVYDTYAGRDIGMLAHETPGHDGLSLIEWLNRVEVLDRLGRHVPDAGQGEVHVTQMHNFSCALIRYSTGDTACWHANPGGNLIPTSRVSELRGRTGEHLVGPQGVVIDPIAIIHVIGVVVNPDWLKKFQLVQKALDRFELRCESWREELTEHELAAFKQRVCSELGSVAGVEQLNVNVRIVSEIPPLPSGKHLYCKEELE